jgi:hypothetical protein
MKFAEKIALTIKRSRQAKEFILLLAGIIIIVLFFLLPLNRLWLSKSVVKYWHGFINDKQDLDPEKRIVKRHGPEYTYSKQVAAFFNGRPSKDVLVLMPPSDYFQARGIVYRVPEPSVFYYFTDLRTTWANSRHAQEANWYVTVRNKTIRVDSVTSKDSLLRIIATFKKYPISL